eukprot:gi/632987549/ref/XP_007882619.1/ PREDICTED: coiled-coil domain-containing protein 50-like [Callorhinchus milii]
MTECSIDKESLPTVTEVRRGFAVLEDRSLAHNLQEQEIEHHLASNVQRNRLVQHDLQVAKRLQEEEDHKAQLRLQKRQREIERRDNQMAQVIQDELALQAEQRRQQEETDEAIARKLQEKEERRRKKHHQDNTSQDPQHHQDNTSQDPYHMESFDESKDPTKSKQHGAGSTRRQLHASRSHNSRRSTLKRESKLKATSQRLSSVTDINTEPGFSQPQCSDTDRHGDYYPDIHALKHQRDSRRREKPVRPPPPTFSSDYEAASSYHNKGARPKVIQVNGRHRDTYKHRRADKPRASHRKRSPSEVYEHWPRGAEGGLDTEEWLERELVPTRQGEDTREKAARSRSPGDFRSEQRDAEQVGLRLESGVKEVTQGICQLSASEWEQRDAELARKLQEEEMLATQEAQKEAQKAAQMAQDEEIARLLMEKEKRAYRKHKGESGRAAEDEGRKRSSERKPHEHDKKYEAGDYTRPKMCDGPEAGLGKPERPVRPPGPKKDSDDFDLNYKSSPQRPPRPSSRSTESSQKASYYRQ